MKVYILDRVNITKLYFIVFIGIILYIFLMIIIIKLIIIINPSFKNVQILFVITALIFGSFLFKLSFLKSTFRIHIELNNKKIKIENFELNIDNIDFIKLHGMMLNYYPKLIINTKDNKNINIRISRDNNFDKLISDLKKNTRIKVI